MIIGVDMDGVLLDDDTYRLDHITKYCFENNLQGMDNPYKYENKCNWSKEILEDYRKKYFFDYIKNAPVRKYASEIIRKLHDEGNKIIIITGRHKTREQSPIGDQMREDTVNWLNKNDIVYDEICFACSPKVQEVKENSIDVMIDDSPDVIEAVTKITNVLCFDNRYNRDLEYENMTRVFSWYDIYMKLREMKKSIEI